LPNKKKKKEKRKLNKALKIAVYFFSYLLFKKRTTQKGTP